MWLCHTKFPSLGLQWASPTDMTGKYGLTEVVCNKVTFEGRSSSPISLIRSLQKIWQILIP
jgi:hypothetical protein